MAGYIYCFSNPCMPGILKVGMTERTPEMRLAEANSSDTWRPPMPYKIEFAVKVSDAKRKERSLHSLLDKYTERVNPRREFFKISLEDIARFFDLMEGETIINNDQSDDQSDYQSDDQSDVSDSNKSRSNIGGCRDMTKCFLDGQRIRHKIGDSIWYGIYNISKNIIIYNDTLFRSLSGFAEKHYSIVRTDRVKNANGWRECECEVDGEWISTYNLPELRYLPPM